MKVECGLVVSDYVHFNISRTLGGESDGSVLSSRRRISCSYVEIKYNGLRRVCFQRPGYTFKADCNPGAICRGDKTLLGLK